VESARRAEVQRRMVCVLQALQNTLAHVWTIFVGRSDAPSPAELGLYGPNSVPNTSDISSSSNSSTGNSATPASTAHSHPAATGDSGILETLLRWSPTFAESCASSAAAHSAASEHTNNRLRKMPLPMVLRLTEQWLLSCQVVMAERAVPFLRSIDCAQLLSSTQRVLLATNRQALQSFAELTPAEGCSGPASLYWSTTSRTKVWSVVCARLTEEGTLDVWKSCMAELFRGRAISLIDEFFASLR
jgi:hypothetical protein